MRRFLPDFRNMRLFFLFLLLFTLVSEHQKVYASVPTKIIIPSISLSLPVETMPIVNDTWKVSTLSASFGATTANPGEAGNTVIFSHALPHLFKNLPFVRKGDIVHVLTDKKWFSYKIRETFTVPEDNTSILQSNQANELTLYTCTGKTFEKRFVAKADLIATPFLLTMKGPAQSSLAP